MGQAVSLQCHQHVRHQSDIGVYLTTQQLLCKLMFIHCGLALSCYCRHFVSHRQQLPLDQPSLDLGQVKSLMWQLTSKS
jgi:hypothetical protein